MDAIPPWPHFLSEYCVELCWLLHIKGKLGYLKPPPHVHRQKRQSLQRPFRLLRKADSTRPVSSLALSDPLASRHPEILGCLKGSHSLSAFKCSFCPHMNGQAEVADRYVDKLRLHVNYLLRRLHFRWTFSLTPPSSPTSTARSQSIKMGTAYELAHI